MVSSDSHAAVPRSALSSTSSSPIHAPVVMAASSSAWAFTTRWPRGGEQPLRVAFDRIAHWTGNGAQMSTTVERLVAQAKATA